MTKNPPAIVSDKHPALSLIIIMAFVGIGFVLVGPLIGMLVASTFYDGSLMVDMLDPNPDPSVAIPLLVVQGFSTLIGLIVLPVVYVNMIEARSVAKLMTEERDLKTYFVLFVLGVCFMVTISPVVEWNMHVQFPDFLKSFEDWAREKEDQLIGVTNLLTGFTDFGQFSLSLIVIALLPAIGEELVFRGLIQNEIQRGTKNAHMAIWGAAILFSAIHMQFFGFVPRMLLGAMFGYLYWWSGNLLIPMIAHFVHNGFTLTMLYLYNIGAVGVNMDEEDAAPMLAVVVCTMITSALLFYLYKYFNSQKTIDEPNSTI